VPPANFDLNQWMTQKFYAERCQFGYLISFLYRFD
jgi:hypothetical protein